jgi:hypothetical protein
MNSNADWVNAFNAAWKPLCKYAAKIIKKAKGEITFAKLRPSTDYVSDQ